MTTTPASASDRVRRRRRAGGTLTALGLVLGSVWVAPAPAMSAAAAVTVTSSLGPGLADAEYATSVRVAGSGFQSIPGGMGGIYVLFGWADEGRWRPSAGGVVGADYLYVPDSESKDNQGFQRFVSFPGSETEAAAQAVMDAAGSWVVDLTIAGPTFEARDRNGDPTSVDCRRVTCGVLTIGAHGVKNANNETFTPISFVAADRNPSASDVPVTSAPVSVAPGTLSLGVETAKIVAGSALAFTARGFSVGEQVVASLDNGVAAVGPLVAGSAGEVAGVIPVPADLAAGTHLLRVQGAATGGVVETEITVVANAAAVSAARIDAATPPWLLLLTTVAICLALALILANIVTTAARARRRWRARRVEAVAA